MPIDFNSNPDGGPTGSESDSPMFAGVPSWERGKKRGLFGGRAGAVAPEPRSFAADETAAPAAMAGELPRREAAPDVGDPAESTFAATPAYASRSAGRRSSSVPIAVAAGIILVGGLAAAGWYYTQPHTQGVAELTPGSATTTTTTASTAGAPLPGEALAQNTAPQAATPEAAAPATPTQASVTTTTTHKTSPAATRRTTTVVARARPAPRSASDATADTAATAPAPAAPQPTPAPAPTAAAPPLVLTLPSPTQAAPAQTAPAPATPAPTQTPPQ